MRDAGAAEIWLDQADNDLKWADASLREGFYSQVCFVSQQIAEKCMKALAYFRGYDLVKSHSVKIIAEKLGINGELLEAAMVLDLYYISTRYPDALPGGAPYKSFSKTQATQALGSRIKCSSG